MCIYEHICLYFIEMKMKKKFSYCFSYFPDSSWTGNGPGSLEYDA
jgi:hypothetical protein